MKIFTENQISKLVVLEFVMLLKGKIKNNLKKLRLLTQALNCSKTQILRYASRVIWAGGYRTEFIFSW